jgi:CPA2 family monovalent cation:H+ antiporter-2
MESSILLDILIIFSVAVPAAYLFHQLKLPPIIGLLVTGVLIGPHGLGFVKDIGRINLLADIGIALLVFSLGLEFSLKHFGEVKKAAIFGGLLQVAATTAAFFGTTLLIGFTWKEGLFLGCTLSLSSTAIVYYILSQKRLIDSPQGRIATGMLVIQDLSAIPMVALLPILLAPHAFIGWHSVGLAMFRVSLVIVIFLVGGGYIMPAFLHEITLTRSKELFLITILVIALGFGYLTDHMGLSFALGAFLAGLMVAETDFRFHALSEIAPFRYCFNGLFFVSIGMLVNLPLMASFWWQILVLALILPLAKAIITAMVIYEFRYPIGIATMVGLALSQIGEFSFIVAAVTRKAGAISALLYNLMIAAAFITIVLTPFAINLAPRAAELMERYFPPHGRRSARRGSVIKADHLKDHVIICGFGPLGSSVGHILEQAQKNYLVLELNPATVKRIKKQDAERPVYLGDGASAEILYKSGIERASVLAITAPDYMNSIAIIRQARAMNPGIKIITRAKFRNQVSALYVAGADIVISEELEAGVEMARYILLHMGINSETIEQYSQTVRAFGSADFF